MPGRRACSSASMASVAFISESQKTIVAIDGPGQTSEVRNLRWAIVAKHSPPDPRDPSGYLEPGFWARKRSLWTGTRRLPRSNDPVDYVALELSYRCGAAPVQTGDTPLPAARQPHALSESAWASCHDGRPARERPPSRRAASNAASIRVSRTTTRNGGPTLAVTPAMPDAQRLLRREKEPKRIRK
jgi:hypothetical protein